LPLAVAFSAGGDGGGGLLEQGPRYHATIKSFLLARVATKLTGDKNRPV
jgi:hypothetical protein